MTILNYEAQKMPSILKRKVLFRLRIPVVRHGKADVPYRLEINSQKLLLLVTQDH